MTKRFAHSSSFHLLRLFSAVLIFSLPNGLAVQAAGGTALEATHGLVVSVSAAGSETGVGVLKKGGNAVDAAVATAFTLAVTYPAAGNLGGGGFMVIYPGKGAEPVVVEYRETAPAAASKTMFSGNDSLYGHKVAGVPGTVRGLALAHQ